MLGGSNYNTYMSRSVIQNCDVTLYRNVASESAFLRKENIVSLRMERTNNGVLDVAPTDNVVIEIINWNSIGSIYKTAMTTVGNYLKLGFVVENSYTDKKIVLCVKDCKVDRRKNRATLTLVSPFEFMTGNNFKAEVQYDVWDITNNREDVKQFFSSFPLRSQTTFFEGVQYHSIGKCRGAVIKNVTYSQKYPLDHTPVTFPPLEQPDYFELKTLTTTTVDVTVDDMNITSEIQESLDSNDRSNIRVIGLKYKEESSWIMSSGDYITWNDEHNPYQWTLNIAEKVGKPIVITELVVHGYNGNPPQLLNKFYYRISNNSVFFYLKDPNNPPPDWGNNYMFNAYGYVAELEDKTVVLDNNEQPYIELPLFFHNSEYTGAVESALRAYYSKKTYIEFDCRLDPRIEPMDVIEIANVGKIKVEKVSMQFDGAFNGHIKGRLLVAY